MLQDIFPHKLYNEYRPQAKWNRESPVLCVREGRILAGTVLKENGPELVLPCAGELEDCEKQPDAAVQDLQAPRPVYAFAIDDTEYFADISSCTYTLPGYSYMDPFDIRWSMDNLQGMIAFTGIHLVRWYQEKHFCGVCGARLSPDERERAMTCPSCGRRFYPRIQPAVIVGVTDGDRLLVTKYKTGYAHFALVAGFAEIGETFEETVAREVMEETGLRVTNIRYYKSQPWGIAQDLLAGFFCDVEGSREIRIDNQELKLAQWRRREEIELQPSSYSLTNEMMSRFRDGFV